MRNKAEPAVLRILIDIFFAVNIVAYKTFFLIESSTAVRKINFNFLFAAIYIGRFKLFCRLYFSSRKNNLLLCNFKTIILIFVCEVDKYICVCRVKGFAYYAENVLILCGNINFKFSVLNRQTAFKYFIFNYNIAC